MAVEISALFTEGDQILGIELERWRQMKGRYVVHLEPGRCPAPLAGRLFFQVFFLDLVPLPASKMRGLASEYVLDKF
jgi:hypothetical protein